MRRAWGLILISALFGGDFASAVTLDEAFTSALANNEMILQNAERVEQANEKLRQAKGAILPNVSLNATHLIQPLPSNPIAAALSPERQTTAMLTLTQPLFKGFREYAALRQRKDLARAQQQDRLAALAAIYQEVAASYFRVLSTEQDLKNISEQQKIYLSRVKDLRGRSQRGESQATEFLVAQATSAKLDSDVITLKSDLIAARENFSLLTALPANSSLVDEDQANVKPMTINRLEDYLARIEQRPDILSAQEKNRALEEGVNIAKGGHWPSLDAVGNYYLERPAGFTDGIDWDVQLKLSLPIYEGGMRTSETREAKSKKREGELGLSRLRRQAMAEIRSIHESLKTRTEQLDALKRSAELSERNVKVLQAESRRGLAKSLDVQVGLKDSIDFRRAYDLARYQARLDLIRLNSAAAIFPSAIVKEQ